MVKLSSSTALLSWWLLLMPLHAQASFESHVSSYVNVQIPTNLHVHNHSGGLNHSEAHFGSHFEFFRREMHLVHRVHYAQGPLCSIPDHNVTKEFGRPPFFLLAEEKACSANQKARVAQELGAAGLIIGTEHTLCEEEVEEDAENCLKQFHAMPDDGTGGSIHIPTVMVSKTYAKHMEAADREKKNAVVEMAFQTPRRRHNITLDLWYSPMHVPTEIFLANFSHLASIMDNQLAFRPHHVILDGRALKCEGQADSEKGICYNMCTNNGKYCSVTHGYNHHGITGKDVVVESLRRMCLWEKHGSQGFWNYVKQFATLCQSVDGFSNMECIDDVFKHSGIDGKDIESCIEDSGGIDADVDNTFLHEAMKETADIVETPHARINGLPLKWSFSSKAVFESMCFGFEYGFAPHVCSACGMCGDPVACAARSPMHCNQQDGQIPEPSKGDGKGGKKKKGGAFKHFVWVTFLLTGIGGFVYYKKYMQDGDNPAFNGYSLGEALMSDTA